MTLCPSGHLSATSDFCDQCGAPLTGAPAVATPVSGPAAPRSPASPGILPPPGSRLAALRGEPAPGSGVGFYSGPAAAVDPFDLNPSPAPAPVPEPPPSLPAPQSCPHCGAPRQARALFCEACGYDYTTGALPSTDLATALGLTSATPSPGPIPVPAPVPVTGPVPVAEPVPALVTSPALVAEPISVPEPVAAPAAPALDAILVTDTAVGEPVVVDADPDPVAGSPLPSTPAAAILVIPPDGIPDAQAEEPLSAPDASLPATSVAPVTVPPATPEAAWVAEVWIDPAWYELQGSPDPIPPAGLPQVFPIRPPAQIGRVSLSRNIHPAVDCGGDTGCSRRQAELTQVGQQWYITDFRSANGTFVAAAGDPLPDEPITDRTAVGVDDRIYVGAWTRIVLRPAAPGELPAVS